MSNNIAIALEPREDRHGSVFHIGRIQFPGFIDCSDGAAFLIFLSEEGQEELQIATVDSEHSTYNQFSRRPDRLNISIQSRVDSYEKRYYVAKVQTKGLIDCRAGVTFMVFTSQEGKEELQIVAPIIIDQGSAATSGMQSSSNMIPRYRAAR